MIILALYIKSSIVTVAACSAHTYLSLFFQLALAGTFIVSGVGKLLDLAGTRQALTDFGLPEDLVHKVAKVFPSLELLVGFAFLLDPTKKIAAILGAMLALSFALGIGNLLRQGRKPPCHCFGAIQSAPVGWGTFIRAVILILLSLGVFLAPAFKLTTSLQSYLLALSLGGLTASGTANYGLWKRLKNRQSTKRLIAGQRLPLIRLSNGQWLSESLVKGQKNVLMIGSSTCGICQAMKPEIERWKKTLSEKIALVEIEAVDYERRAKEEAEGSAKSESEPQIDKLEFSINEVSTLATGTPGALLVDDKGVLLMPPVIGQEQIEALLRVALAD